MIEHDKRTVASVRRLQDALHFQRGVAYALREVVIEKKDPRIMLSAAMQRLDELLELAEKENGTK